VTTGLDRTYHAHHFIFSFTFFVCSVWWTKGDLNTGQLNCCLPRMEEKKEEKSGRLKLATRQLFTARYIHTVVSYHATRTDANSRVFWRSSAIVEASDNYTITTTELLMSTASQQQCDCTCLHDVKVK